MNLTKIVIDLTGEQIKLDELVFPSDEVAYNKISTGPTQISAERALFEARAILNNLKQLDNFSLNADVLVIIRADPVCFAMAQVFMAAFLSTKVWVLLGNNKYMYLDLGSFAMEGRDFAMCCQFDKAELVKDEFPF